MDPINLIHGLGELLGAFIHALSDAEQRRTMIEAMAFGAMGALPLPLESSALERYAKNRDRDVSIARQLSKQQMPFASSQLNEALAVFARMRELFVKACLAIGAEAAPAPEQTLQLST
jgi:hypothetical protein